ncbi:MULTISPECIES: hypothetical protein [unclassified Psychrobacter]|uniref:XAC2610-related protein n=1 Tax=unclassified Psychrobacter TaxID=196806 RepID=UPI000947017E|nr:MULTISPECIES: hypothetical protein [unclassified Psychrobacter]OLF41329.1 hypothetical protein BTV99_04590 [Psychrobacter sp. Rd 27.2]PJX25003.1 hypothetical protein CAP50_05460 [Psychrobacter sp. L7]
METFNKYRDINLIIIIYKIMTSLIFLTLVLLTYEANAQSNKNFKNYVLNNSGNAKTFKIRAITCSNNTWDYCFTPVSVEIKDRFDSNWHQTININTAVPSLQEMNTRLSSDTRTRQYSKYERYTFIFGDFNYDGYTDFAYISGLLGNYGSPSYTFYLYNQNKKTYESDLQFSELTTQGRSVPDFNYVQKEIVSSEKNGSGNLSSYYHIKSNEPQLFKVISRDYISKADKIYLKTTTKVLNSNNEWTSSISYDEYTD